MNRNRPRGCGKVLEVVLLVAVLACTARVEAGSKAPSHATPISAPQLAQASAQEQAPRLSVEVIRAEKMDVSPPLRDMVPPSEFKEKEREIENRQLQKYGGLRGEAAPEGVDPVLQASKPREAIGTPLQNWEGIGNLDGVLPPDPTGAVGPNHYLQWVNLHMAVYSKSGALLWGPNPGNTIWQGFGGPCDSCNDGDPVVLYDHLADRWVISQFVIPSSTSGPYYQYVAVSATGDPLGSWYRYSFLWGNGNNKFNDYPKLGLWPDGYYMTANQFTSASGSWAGAGVAVLDRISMLQGLPATIQYIDLYSVNANFGGMLPGSLDGPAPPAGSPDYFAEVDDSSTIGPSDAMRIWEFHVDWANPANTTFGLSGNPNQVLTVAPFTPICPTTRNCIPQPGTNQKLDAIGDRLMFRLQYRNFGTYETLVTNHTVDAGSGKAGVRWYEMRKSGGSWSIYQQGTYAPDADNRWMASAAMNKMGDIAVGFSVSSTSTYPSIRYAGRLAGDPLGQLTQGEATLMAGTGYQSSTYARWGDYSTLSLDPTDNCTFWYTQEYIQTSGTANWQTRVGSFKLTCCITPGVPSALSASTPADNQVALSWTAGSPAGATYRVYRSIGACPAGSYSLLASGVTGTAYTDGTVSGGTTYAYVVTAVDSTGNCESGQSGCAQATATGPCTAPPTFAGLASVTSPGNSTCTLVLSWSPATPNCGGPVYYNVYRGTTSGFTPSPANRIATGVVGTSFVDTAGLVYGTTYYYVVRAVDQANGIEDANTVRVQGAPVGVPVPSTLLSENFDAWGAGTFANGWSKGYFSGDANDWRGAMACSGQSPPNILRCGGNGCTKNYGNNKHAFAQTPMITVPAGSNTVRLSFYHRWLWENGYDGGYLCYSLDGSTYTYIPSSAVLSGPAYNAVLGAWTDIQSTMVQTVVDLDAALGGSAAGKSFYIAFVEVTDATIAYDGWFIDNVSITANTPGPCSSGLPPGSLKPVPDGTGGTTAMRASKGTSDGGQLSVSWDVTHCPSTNYNLYYGYGSQLSSYGLAGSACWLGTSGTATWSNVPDPSADPSHFLWWVMVGTDGTSMESSWGQASSGAERHPAASNQCGFTAKSTATTCP